MATQICMPFPGIGGFPWMKCAEDTKLQVTLSADVDLDGIVIYADVTL